MPIAVDGTSRHEVSYVHCTLRGTSSPNLLASWWLLGCSEEWATLYTATQGVDFDQQLWDASKAVFQDTGGSDRKILFFPFADGRAQILIANCKNWKAEAPQASVCWVCRYNRARCLLLQCVDNRSDWENHIPPPVDGIFQSEVGTAAFPTMGCIPTMGCTGCCVSLNVVFWACATQWRVQRASLRLPLYAVCFSPF